MKLDALEQESAAVIQKFLVFHEIRSPGVPVTNVSQIFALVDLNRSHRSHPYFLQDQFREFGAQSGFTTSIYEKYVPVPFQVANLTAPGRGILMSAKPFANPDGELVRIIIWKAADQDYRIDRIKEARVREIFSENRITIPTPSPMPAPEAPPGYKKSNYPLTTRVRIFFEDVAYYYGPGRFFWLPMMLVCLGLPLIIAVVLFVWFIRRSRRD